MSITIEFLQIFAAFAVLIGFSVAVGIAIGKGARPNDHTAEDDDEQAAYLKQEQKVRTNRMRAGPITESKS